MSDASVAARSAVAARPQRSLPPAWIGLGAVLAGLVVWEIYGRIIHSPIFPYPSAVLRAVPITVREDELLPRLQSSGVVLTVGLLLAIVAGIPLGVLIALRRTVEYAADPYINAIYATPAVAFMPVIILWLGFQISAKVALVFIFCVFPILINTYQGVKNIDARLVEVASSFCSGQSRLWRDLILPSAAPFILAGIRLSIGRGLVGMVVAEMNTSLTGLGYSLVQYMNTFKADRMFVVIGVLMIMGVGLTGLFRSLERRIAPWLHAVREE